MTKKLRDYTPALKYGAKIYPEDIAGLIGRPYVGNVVYVDGSGGSDNSGGSSFDDALATVGAAEDRLTSGQHDVALIVPSGGSGRTTETIAIGWDKRFTHLIGSAGPLVQDARAGLNFAVGGSITFSDNGCLVQNITLFSDADIDSTVEITGDYNSFLGVDFKGTSNATSIGSTPWRALTLTGAEENYFGGCTIGADTYLRSATNASLELKTATARNVFEGCLFPIATDDASAVFVKAASVADVDRFVWFKDCFFHNGINSASTQMTDGMDIHAAVGGTIVLDGCSVLGVDDWANDFGSVYGMNMPDITAGNAGFLEKIAT